MSHPLDIPLRRPRQADLVFETGGPYDTFELTSPNGASFTAKANATHDAWVIDAMPLLDARVDYNGEKPCVKVRPGTEAQDAVVDWVYRRLCELTYEFGGAIRRPKRIPAQYRARWCDQHRVWELSEKEFYFTVRKKQHEGSPVKLSGQILDPRYKGTVNGPIGVAAMIEHQASMFLEKHHGRLPHQLADYEPDDHPCARIRG